MTRRPPRRRATAVSVVLLVAVVAVVAVVTPLAAASPAPVSACPPCDGGFVSAADEHGLDTAVRHSEATVRVHANGSATWTARVVPTNGTVLSRLAANRSLARAVAADSFGVRYGDGIDHDILAATVVDGAFVIRYRTLDVARDGPFNTTVLTYFRDSPGAYVYTDLGADELTVVAPPGRTVARGFGTVEGDRLTATALPDVRDGPFVVFAPGGGALPGLVGTLAVLDAIGGVLVRNVLLFVALPGGVLVAGLAAVRRLVDPTTDRDPARVGALVAAGGVLILAWTLFVEADALPALTGILLLGSSLGAVLLTLGAAAAVRPVRQRLSAGLLLAAGVAAAAAVLVLSGRLGGAGIHDVLSVGVAVLPTAVALGRVDASERRGAGRRLFVGTAAGVGAALAVTSPLTALGGSLFLLVPIILTAAAVGGVVAAAPLYVLGAASAASDPGRSA